MSRFNMGVAAVGLFVLAGVSGLCEYSSTWSPERQRANPGAYISHLLRQVEEDASALRQHRTRLQQQHLLLCEQQQRIRKQMESAAEAAVELRSKHASGTPRVLALGQMWTRDQLETQISSLLAELAAAESAFAHLQNGREQLEAELERLTTQQTESAAAVQLLQAQRELAKCQQNSGVSLDQLSRQVADLLTASRSLTPTPQTRSRADDSQNSPRPPIAFHLTQR